MELEIIAITGPTASGKTAKAVELAHLLNGEIISADSRQVYIGMDIGTGKDLEEYGEIPYHLIDITPAGEKYNLHNYLRDFEKAESDIKARGKRVIVCGGSGLYLESVLSGIKLPIVDINTQLRQELKGKTLEQLTDILKSYKQLHNTTDIDTCQRAIRAIEIAEYYSQHPEARQLADKRTATPRNARIFLLDISRELRRQRITERLDIRLRNGMVEEVKSLLDKGIPAENLIYYGLEYKFVTLYLIGQLSYAEMRARLEIEIHKFAKRQMTWFRGMERRGFNLIHLPFDLPVDDYPIE